MNNMLSWVIHQTCHQNPCPKAQQQMEAPHLATSMVCCAHVRIAIYKFKDNHVTNPAYVTRVVRVFLTLVQPALRLSKMHYITYKLFTSNSNIASTMSQATKTFSVHSVGFGVGSSTSTHFIAACSGIQSPHSEWNAKTNIQFGRTYQPCNRRFANTQSHVSIRKYSWWPDGSIITVGIASRWSSSPACKNCQYKPCGHKTKLKNNLKYALIAKHCTFVVSMMGFCKSSNFFGYAVTHCHAFRSCSTKSHGSASGSSPLGPNEFISHMPKLSKNFWDQIHLLAVPGCPCCLDLKWASVVKQTMHT